MLAHVGTPRDFAAEGFTPRDHLELGEGLAAIDTERGAKVSGARFYFLTGDRRAPRARAAQRGDRQGARRRVHARHHADAGQARDHGRHRLPRRARRRDLPPRGRRPVPRRHQRGRARRLPLGRDPRPVGRPASGTPAGRRATAARPARTARTPAASSACTSSTRSRCSATRPSRTPPTSTAASSRWEEEMLALVELPYRVIDTAAGDLGSSAARKFDCEAWLPSQERYLELTSTSNCTTFQARRLGVRERTADGSTRAVATLNGTLATTRWIVAILENHQQADGSVRVPGGAAPVPGRPRGAGAGAMTRCRLVAPRRRRDAHVLRRRDLRRGARGGRAPCATPGCTWCSRPGRGGALGRAGGARSSG